MGWQHNLKNLQEIERLKKQVESQSAEIERLNNRIAELEDRLLYERARWEIVAAGIDAFDDAEQQKEEVLRRAQELYEAIQRKGGQ